MVINKHDVERTGGYKYSRFLLVLFCWKEWWIGEGLTPLHRISFHADSNELLFILIMLTLMEILIDCDGALFIDERDLRVSHL